MTRTLTITLFLALNAFAQDHKDMQHDGVNRRGDKVMGFSHDKTTHHFRLAKDGGAIEVIANDAKDTVSRDQIQMHLRHIAGMFAEGNFKAPRLIHEVSPPGVPVMQTLKEEINYVFSKSERGGEVRITTKNPEVLKAIHEFLRFQITDHKTGDSTDVK